ncbi:isoleucine--tRNA ligase [Jatrophihabitans sp.]|uniref:isoleucine--tRNA ligase n=1 Tax=Jatrophihabitans sp. TaxID=1932789 RepID=UPI0030C745D6
MPGYEPLPAHIDLAELDHAVIDGWREQGIFARSLEQTASGPRWTFYEGPPTANGMPGTHHVEARAFKDVFPRFKTMKGFHVDRMAGWDCHGLPVELAVEKELGFTGKPDIENYGIAEFNARCRENVQRHVDAFESMSERMGYWADYENAYWTMNPEYVESVWWALKTIFDKGLLVEDYRVAPYCPRCGTTLSDHEVAQGYEDVTDPSVYVRFPLTSGPWAGRADLLVWTTTPWTLVSNTAVAVNPVVNYVVVKTESANLIVAEPLLEKVLGEEFVVLETFTGRELERWTYQRPFEYVELEGANFVVLADYVTTSDGTGLVHQAPAFGADDLAVCRSYGLPVVNPVGSDGHFVAGLPLVGGEFFKDADEPLVTDLRARDLLFRHVPYTHSYPHCWRCHTPLMYYALPSWYIRTTEIKDQLLAENEKTSWYPSTIKHGRYGDWLNNNIDWALSRDRYWGTPLPVWRNDADPSRMVCIGSLAELESLSGVALADPHRPYVDDVTFALPGEEGTFRRVPQVIDAWFDSGSMPFAQFGAPHRNAELAAAAYPADYICEAIDQTRGWFYTLMAVGTLVHDESSYRTVLCLGHILAEDGRKMSKHLGNILEPMPLMDRHGADALRWFMLCTGSPWSARRVGHKLLEEIASKVLRTYWSVASFQSLYARANSWEPGTPVTSERTVLDRWALSEVHRLTVEVDAALEDFDTARAGKALAQYIDDLSNWYVRRSRRRFWDGDDAALATLHECLEVLTRLLAPFIPFVTDRVWQAMFAAGTGVDSVHLATWPVADTTLIDVELGERVGLVRRLVELGRSARADSKMKTRQPLARALISAPGWALLPPELKDEVRDELNVVELADLADTGELVELSVKANFRVLGRRFGKNTQAVANVIAEQEPVTFVAAYRAGTAAIEFEGETLPISGEEIIVSETPRSGWAVASAVGDTVALDLELTHELRLIGLLRDVVRFVQDTRKGSGLDVTDRIDLWWRVGGSPAPAEAIRTHADQLASEVLASTLVEGAGPDDVFTATDDDLGLTIWLRRA